jgi:hypothetical protein
MPYNPQQIGPKLEVNITPISEAEEQSPGGLAGPQRQLISEIRRKKRMTGIPQAVLNPAGFEMR